MRTNKIINAVSQALEIPVSLMKSDNRKRDVVDSRRIAIGIMRSKCKINGKKITFKAIGRIFSRDHSSIMHALDSYEDLSTNKEFKAKIEKVKLLL